MQDNPEYFKYNIYSNYRFLEFIRIFKSISEIISVLREM
jgi:hypothetical protein